MRTKANHEIISYEKDYIKREVIGLAIDATIQIYCPFCDNTHPWKPSMSVSRVDCGVLYHCHRAGCGKSGFYGSLPSGLDKRTKEFTPRVFAKNTRELTQEEYCLLSSSYDLTVEEINNNQFKWLSHAAGLMMPLYTRGGKCFGKNIKYFDKETYKSILYLESQAPKVHFPDTSCLPVYLQETMIIVEDVISSIRVSRFGQGVALLGTHLSEEMVKDLCAHKPNKVLFALDPDAFTNAVELRNRYAFFFPSTEVVCLSKDPKDLSHDQLEEELGL